MTVREIMVHKRKTFGLSTKEMALQKYGISEVLLKMIENGAVTHPEIAKKIQNTLGLTDLQTEELLPLHRRPHGGDYDPDRYAIPPEEFLDFSSRR